MSTTDSLKKWLNDFKNGTLVSAVDGLRKVVTDIINATPAATASSLPKRPDEPYIKDSVPVTTKGSRISPTVATEFLKYIKTNYQYLPEDFLTITKFYSRSYANVLITLRVKNSKSVRKYLEKISIPLQAANRSGSVPRSLSDSSICIMEDNMSDELIVGISVDANSAARQQTHSFYCDTKNDVVVPESEVGSLSRRSTTRVNIDRTNPLSKFLVDSTVDARRIQSLTRIIKTLSRKAYVRA